MLYTHLVAAGAELSYKHMQAEVERVWVKRVRKGREAAAVVPWQDVYNAYKGQAQLTQEKIKTNSTSLPCQGCAVYSPLKKN